MRERWTRTTPFVQIGEDEAAELIRPALGDVTIARIEPIGGGHSNTNIRVDLKSAPHCVVLRLYQRDPAVARKEAAIARLVSGKVPAPRYLHTGEHLGRTYAVVEFVEGETLASAAKRASADELSNLGRLVGAALAAIHSFTFDQAGFLDGDLKITPFPAGFALSGFLETCLSGLGGERLGRELAARVMAFAKQNEKRQDVWNRPARLTHFDFGGTNILVRSDGSLKVAGIVDWEFAAAASPAADFGNLLRPPLGTMPGFVSGVEQGYRDGGGFLPDDWRELTRIADMGAWAEFLTRPTISEQVIEEARNFLSDITSGSTP